MRDGRRTLATRVFNGQEMFALDELAKMFDLAIREDTVVGALTVATKTQTIALTPGQALASAGGRVVSSRRRQSRKASAGSSRSTSCRARSRRRWARAWNCDGRHD